MDQILASFKEYLAVLLGALISLATLVVSSRLTEGRERRKVYWEREHAKFVELQEAAGILVEDLMRYRMRQDDERVVVLEKMKDIRAASGRFLRYPLIASALRDLENVAGWYIHQDMKHETSEDFKIARADVDDCFKKLVVACDATLKRNAP